MKSSSDIRTMKSYDNKKKKGLRDTIKKMNSRNLSTSKIHELISENRTAEQNDLSSFNKSG